MKQNNEKLRTVSIINGQICIDWKQQTDYKETYKNESIDNTVKLFDNNKIVSLTMYKPKSIKPKSTMEFNLSMTVNEYNNKIPNNKPLSPLEYCLKGHKLPLNLITNNDVKMIKSKRIDTIQIRNIIIPIYKGTLDLRVWISPKTIDEINIDDKKTTVSELYDKQQKQEHVRELAKIRKQRQRDNEKNGIIKTTISSMDYLTMNAINHIGKKPNLPIIDLWENSHITTQYDINGKIHIVSINKPNLLTVSDDTQKHAIAYLKLNNHRLNVEKYMNQRLNNFFNTHKSRLITAIDKNRQKQIAIRKIQEQKAIQLNKELTVYANTQKSNYVLKIHVCDDIELIEIAYSKYKQLQTHLSSMNKTTITKSKHNMHN